MISKPIQVNNESYYYDEYEQHLFLPIAHR